MLEIERKFLVISDDFKKEAITQNYIAQGYLNSDANRTVRIRIKGNKGFITIKGKSNASGMSRFEWEKEIAFDEAKTLLEMCEPGLIVKIRYEVPIGDFVYEIDEFLGDNVGLIVAEIELKSETDVFEKPTWLGEEVTLDARYYNSYLSKCPFGKWNKSEF